MLRDDMLLRQIRKLVQGLLQAARFRREKDVAQADQTLDDVLRDELGLSADMVRALDAATLLRLLSPSGELDRRRATALGLVLAERARLAAASGADDDAAAWRQKALAVLDAAGEADAAQLVDDDGALERHARGLEAE